jgi:hypothetical protein
VHRVRVYQNSNRTVHRVAQFVINPESFPEINGGERGKSSTRGETPHSKRCPRVLRLGARIIPNPRTVVVCYNRSGKFCRLEH